jgi:hypothetical protein
VSISLLISPCGLAEATRPGNGSSLSPCLVSMQLAVFAVKLVWVGPAGMAIPPMSASPLPYLDRCAAAYREECGGNEYGGLPVKDAVFASMLCSNMFQRSGLSTVGSFRNQSGTRLIGRQFSVQLASPRWVAPCRGDYLARWAIS